MPNALALVRRADFERDAMVDGRLARVGDVVPLRRYAGSGFTPLGAWRALFLVTVRPPDERLWLVAVLESPTFDGEAWVAARGNVVPVTDLSGVMRAIDFATGPGLGGGPGAFETSLQTARVLTDADVALLRAAARGAGAPAGPRAAAVHLNAHETGGPAPCLCRRCLDLAPERVLVGDLALVRERAEARGRFLWFWMPEASLADRDAIRRAVASRLYDAPARPARRRRHERLDAAFEGGEGEP